ncbi:MAG: hypothetical protein GF411_02650 [Candidatus Lokiarchaeota archaeon]|nr:hypothetical protein [Candidatus Lokiarchaeota archaeon]
MKFYNTVREAIQDVENAEGFLHIYEPDTQPVQYFDSIPHWFSNEMHNRNQAEDQGNKGKYYWSFSKISNFEQLEILISDGTMSLEEAREEISDWNFNY